ncbi:MAG: polyprenyl synthetase family protein [Bacteriovoracaceae bacterium]|nr:polyprenyl synthetase family protein [Bacteroidota bacterium]
MASRSAVTHSLDDIKAPVEREIKEFSGFFKNAMKSNVFLVDTIARYIVKQKGKRIRPIIVFLCAKACGSVNHSTFRGATLVEILHTATLVHDDVVDDADTRRGLASINAVWKNKIAVLMGDYLLSTGLMISLNHNDVYFLKVTSDSVRRMSEGEILQIQKSRELNIDEATYLKIISNKTASLLSTCSEIGAASVTEDLALRKAMKEYGENVGMAFQIRDDILDFTSRKSILGKPIGGDLKEKKITLPLIFALGQAPKQESRKVLKMIKAGATNKDVEFIVDFVQRHGGVAYAETRAYEFGNAARDCLKLFPETDAKHSLEHFIDFVMEREK